jgi:hypothetical protein
MPYRDDLQIWAKTLVVDELTSTEQRDTIPDEIYDKGWLREKPVSAQHLNQILNTITGVLKEETVAPVDPASTAILNSIYPVTSTVQLSQNATDPATVFGFGTWNFLSNPTPTLWLWERTA